MSPTRFVLVVALTGCASGCDVPSSAPPPGRSPVGTHVVLTGIVRDAAEQPLEGVRIEIATDSNAIATTDDNGHFRVSGLTMANGHVHLIAAKDGYIRASRSFPARTVGGMSRNNELRLTLECDARELSCASEANVPMPEPR